MQTFDTPRPIAAEVSIGAGSVHLIASERGDTTVAVNPSDPSVDADVAAVDRTTVELFGRRLVVETEKSGGIRSVVGFTKTGSVDVTIELPESSSLELKLGAGALTAVGVYDQVTARIGAGPVHIDECGECEVSTGFGNMSLNHARGDARVRAGGDMRLERIDGTAEIKNVNGRTWIGDVDGHLRVSSANGDISVDRAGASVAAKTASGSIALGEVTSGAISVETAAGGLNVGIKNGSVAWVDARTKFGTVHNSLEATGAPGDSTDEVEIRARTSFGDIDIHRSSINNESGEK